MKIQNYQNQQKTNFTGLDARKLKGIVMSSNFAGIADEMKRIGDIENFKVFLLERTPKGIELKTDCFQLSNDHKGCWAQDHFGVVNDTLLEYENTDKPQLLKRIFGFKANPVQKQIREEMNYPQVQEYVDLLYNMPISTINGKEGIVLEMPEGIQFIDKKIYDAEFKINSQILKNIINNTHIKGGNYYITQNPNGTKEVLVGANELKKLNTNQIQEMFQVDKVHIIPQADYHIDLFIRPLKDNKVLIADDQAMLQTLQEGFKKIQQTIINSPQSERLKFKNAFVQTGIYTQQFEKILQTNPYAKTQEVEKALIAAGYEPIKVPGRIFEVYSSEEADMGKDKYILKNLINFINAHVHINNKGETIYITNKSNIDETLGLTEEIKNLTGFSLEQAFLDSIKPHVDKVYFVSGKDNAIGNTLLPEYYGGIHCMGMELP